MKIDGRKECLDSLFHAVAKTNEHSDRFEGYEWKSAHLRPHVPSSAETYIEDLTLKALLLGTEDFIEKFRELLTKKKHLREVPRVQRHLDMKRDTDISRPDPMTRWDNVQGRGMREAYCPKKMRGF